jgi:hypothetical protein
MPINRATTVMDQGTYFVANNGATGIANASAPTAYSDTAPMLTIQNKTAAGAVGPSLYLDWLRAYETAAGTGGVSCFLKAQLDNTVATGGTLLVPVSPSSVAGAVSAAAVRIQPTGIAATGNVRVIIGNQMVVETQTTPIAVNTEFNLFFGSADLGSFTEHGVAVVALSGRSARSWPPIVIGPGYSLSIQMLITTQSASSSWAWELGWVEF